jgi:hypothetical protein
MGLGGKPPREFTETEIKQLRVFAGIRLPNEHMAAALGMSQDTFERALKKNDTARAAVLEGRASASKNIRGTLYSLALGVKNTGKKGGYKIKPDYNALKFWCQTQEGFKSADRLELTGANGGPIETTQETQEERLKRIAELNKKLELTEDE